MSSSRSAHDDDPWLWIDGQQLVVSSEWGLQEPGAWVGAHVNVVEATIGGAFEFGVQLAEIDADGALVSVLQEHSAGARVSSEPQELFECRLPLRAPARYRITIRVARDGGDLGIVRTHLSVPEQVLEAELEPARFRARAGEALAFTLVNCGSTTLSFGAGYRLQRQAGARWLDCNVEELWALIGHGLEPGQRHEQHAHIPENAPAGRYRVSKDVRAVGTSLTRTLTFEVEVAPD